MRTAIILAAVAVAVASAPAAAETVRVGSDSYVTRMTYKDLKTVAGRAEMMAALQNSAERLCDGVQPRRDAEACERRVVDDAAARAIPQVGQLIRLAQAEQKGEMYASK